VGMITPLDLRS